MVHHYFGSKEQLFTAIVESGLQYLQEARRLALAGGGAPEDQLRRWVSSVTLSLGQTGVYQLYSRLVMQILGAPGMHPTACTQALSQFTQTEINTLAQVLTDMGRSAEEASTLSCLAFNTLYGSQMFGTKDSKSIKILRETGCRLLGVAVDSDPRTPPLPWAEDDQSDRR